MIRITKEADYGIMLLGYMAERPRGEIHTAREVAQRSGLPLPMVSKLDINREKLERRRIRPPRRETA